MIKKLLKNKEIILDLSFNDFSTKYAGSSLGIFWAFVQPLITILVYWCVFEFGLKAQSPITNSSYIVWFASGMIPWFFFSDGINAVTNSLLEYGYLVKKVVFDIDFLPIIKIISTFLVHIVFVIFLIIISILNNQPPSIYIIQILYYMIATAILIYAIGQSTASIVLFFRDISQFVTIILQIGLWATPIIWSYTIVPEQYRWIVKLNPVFYIVEGYRSCLIEKEWFFEHPLVTLYFWVSTFLLFFIGNVTFKTLKPHFADVL